MNKYKLLIIGLILGIAGFTHFYRIDHTYVFQNDEGRDALIAYRMLDTGKPILLGPETSVGNMYLGPFYYYLMVPALFLSNLDPVGPAMMVGFFGVGTTFLLIFLGKKYQHVSAGIVAGLFYALSPVMVYYSRSSWNPNVISFFIVLMLYIYPLSKKWQTFAFGVLTGIIFQLHYVALIIPVLLLIFDLYQKIKVKDYQTLVTNLVLIFIGFLFASLPFWLFESRHGFINSKAFMTYLMAKSGSGDLGYPSYLNRLITNAQLLTAGIFGSSTLLINPISLNLFLLIVIIFVLYIVFSGGILSYLTIFSLIIVSVLKEQIHIHYLGFLFPIVSLIVGLSLFSKNWISRVLTAIFLIVIIGPFYQSLSYNLGQLDSTQPRRARETAAYITAQATGRSYNVVNASSGSSATILYYLAISPNPPKSAMQPLLFVICENALCSNDIETNPQLFLNGPSHPAVINYLGYTPSLDQREYRQIVKNEWVTYDVHVATVQQEP